MNKAEREQLKHNEAADALMSASTFASQHGRTIGLGLVGVLLVVGSLLGYRAFKARTEERAAAQLSAAVEILNAPVTPPAAAATPGTPPVAPAAAGTYATEAARADAALAQLTKTAEDFGSTDAGLRARYYAA
ncbi:MAG TPA: hypothetical protein VMF13_02560, partial [Luteitalea sp.]|nr:hypothetical protein [Luteitalea sp.]